MTRGGTALRTSGGLITIRPVRPDDRPGLHALDAQASDRSIHYRFFSVSRSVAERYTDSIAAAPQTDQRDSVVAVLDDDIVGLAALEQIAVDTGEIAVLIADSVQHEGIGTLLVEELVVAAHRRRLAKLTADVLGDNTPMLAVLRDLGLPMSRDYRDGVAHLVIDLEADAGLSERVTERERRAETASLHSVLSPASIVVVGVGSRENSVGRALLRNLIAVGYPGDLAVVHPREHEILGLRAVRSVDRLAVAPDLGIVAVPAAAVLDVVDQLGKRGTRAVLLLTSGFGELGADGRRAQADLLACVRAHGMRLVGPNCLGVVNTDPKTRLNATFATMPMLPGGLALASQSGAVGIAIAHAAAERDLGIAAFVSMGNKADVSSNDLLLAWLSDDRVRVMALYLESVGNPRKFSRIARYVSRTKPILALKSGRGAVAQLAGQSHTAAAAAPEPVVDALFAQAGVHRLADMEQLLDAARVLDHQPLPRGPRVAIVGNSGGPEILATDAAESAGLQVPELSDPVRTKLRATVPSAASVRNPVDLGAAVQPEEIEQVLRVLFDSDEVDAVLTVFTETLAAAPTAVRSAVLAVAPSSPVTLIATEVGTQPHSLPIPDSPRALPVFGFPENAVRALAVAAEAAATARRPTEPAVRPSELRLASVRTLVDELGRDGPRWLTASETARLLGACGLPLARQEVAHSSTEAAHAAAEIGYPVALKRAAGVHKSETHGVFVDVRNDREARRVLRTLGHTDVLVQAMYTGTELIVGGLQDAQFGPLVMTGPGGVLTDIATEHCLRLAPLTAADVDIMLTGPVMSRLLDGFRGRPPVSRAALADLVVRVAWLVEHFPEVAELDLNPVICSGDQLVVVDAKLRLAATGAPIDPVSRLLAAERLAVPR